MKALIISLFILILNLFWYPPINMTWSLTSSYHYLGDMDAADREIEQFKQFCFNSVPVQNRAKVNFDVKNISFKKKT